MLVKRQSTDNTNDEKQEQVVTEHKETENSNDENSYGN